MSANESHVLLAMDWSWARGFARMQEVTSPCALTRLLWCMQATEMHGLLAPDSSWMDPPGWEVNRELLLDAAARQPWHNRTSKLMFRGAPTGMRQWMLGPELSWLK